MLSNIKLAADISSDNMTAEDAVVHGDVVHPPLLRNPYKLQDLNAAVDYENGYEYAQSIGPQQIDQAKSDAWARATVPWREGMIAGLKSIGRGDIGDMIQQTIKGASAHMFWATEYMKIAGPFGYYAGSAVFGGPATLAGAAVARENAARELEAESNAGFGSGLMTGGAGALGSLVGAVGGGALGGALGSALPDMGFGDIPTPDGPVPVNVAAPAALLGTAGGLAGGYLGGSAASDYFNRKYSR